MVIDEKFNRGRGKIRRLFSCLASLSMNTQSYKAYATGTIYAEDKAVFENRRVGMRLRRNDTDATLLISMSRSEARQLGRQLLEYGSRSLEGDAE